MGQYKKISPNEARGLFWGVVLAILAFFIVLIVSAMNVLAEPRPCVDTLAGAQYPKELRHVPNHVAIGGFARTFGADFFPVAKKELDKGRHFIRTQLVWKDNHQFGKPELKAAIKEAKRYNILCTAFPGRIEISPFTEHNISKPDSYLDKIQAAAPNCQIVNNPWRGGLSKKYKNEVHNTHSKAPPKPFNFSYDGESSVDSDVTSAKEKYKQAELLCVWHPRLNLKWSMKDTASRPQRIKEANQRKPDKRMLESLVYLFTERSETKIPSKWLVKSHAERHQFIDAKGDRLLLISPIQADAITLKRNDKTVVKLPFYGAFDGGGWRYYAPGFGYEYGKNLDVYIGKKKFGNIDAGFRSAPYR